MVIMFYCFFPDYQHCGRCYATIYLWLKLRAKTAQTNLSTSVTNGYIALPVTAEGVEKWGLLPFPSLHSSLSPPFPAFPFPCPFPSFRSRPLKSSWEVWESAVHSPAESGMEPEPKLF